MTYQNDAETPLTMRDWRRAAADIAFSTALSEDTCERNCLVRLVALLASHPAEKFVDAVADVSPMIEARAYASAALSIIEPHASYLLSSPVDGCRMATVVLKDSNEEHHAEGATAAIALVGAFAAALAGSHCMQKLDSSPESQTFHIN